MNGAIEIAGKAIVAPLAVSLVVSWLSPRLLHTEAAARYASAVGLAMGFCAGFILLGSWADLTPSRHWHWTFYLALGAAALGAIAVSKGLALPERWLLLLIGAFVAAWLLVPNWPSLHPPRSTWIPLLATYLFLLAALIEPLMSRLPAVRMLALLSASALCVAVLIAAFVSLTYAQFAVGSAAALAGCAFAARLSNTSTVRGVGLAYALVVGGWAFVGCIEPREPLLGILIAPVAPLAALVVCARTAGSTARMGCDRRSIRGGWSGPVDCRCDRRFEGRTGVIRHRLLRRLHRLSASALCSFCCRWLG